MPFLKNAWYVAAWADELAADAMLWRKILSQSIVIFREPSGRAVALIDRCPHKFAPLHLGKLKDGVVECAYHGLRFNGQGACVLNPHADGPIPANARVVSYPIEERDGILWIWMGDAGRADPALIPDLAKMGINDGPFVKGHLLAPCGYELMIDNLLDLGHIAYLHNSSIGSQAVVGSTRSCRQDGDTVIYELWAPNGDPAPIVQFVMPWFKDQKVDLWLVSTWRAPGIIHQLTGTALAGANRQNASVANGFHLLTPETETTCHYFNGQSRNYRVDDPQLDALMLQATEHVFTQEDFPMVGAIQEEMSAADPDELNPLVLGIDAGGVLARKILQRQLRPEAATSSDAPAEKAPELASVRP